MSEKESIYHLNTWQSKLRYLVISLALYLFLRTVENAIHEFSHAVMVLISGGHLLENPFLITPFGGYTRWGGVPREWLVAVRAAGTLGSLCFMSVLAIPLYRRGRGWMKIVGYWGIVIFMNITFYWFLSPIISQASRFDPVAVAKITGISPVCIIGLPGFFPFLFSVLVSLRVTGTLTACLDDPDRFHWKIFAGITLFSFTMAVLVYMRITDAIISM